MLSTLRSKVINQVNLDKLPKNNRILSKLKIKLKKKRRKRRKI